MYLAPLALSADGIEAPEGLDGQEHPVQVQPDTPEERHLPQACVLNTSTRTERDLYRCQHDEKPLLIPSEREKTRYEYCLRKTNMF